MQRRLSPAGRQAIRLAAKRRWADYRKRKANGTLRAREVHPGSRPKSAPHRERFAPRIFPIGGPGGIERILREEVRARLDALL